jgi:hypothetical protein
MKSKLKEIVERDKLTSVMNNSRWNALFESLAQIEEMIHFRTTYIDGTCFPELGGSSEYTPEIEQFWGNFLAVEYLDIVSKLSVSHGALMEPEVHDYTKKVVEVCLNNKAKTSLTKNGVRVWGYFRPGSVPDLIKGV